MTFQFFCRQIHGVIALKNNPNRNCPYSLVGIATLRCLLDWFSIWDFSGFRFVKPKVHTAPEPARLRAVFLTGNGNNFSSPAHRGHSLPLPHVRRFWAERWRLSASPFFCQHPKMSDFTIWLVTSVLIAACFKDNNIFATLIFPLFFFFLGSSFCWSGATLVWLSKPELLSERYLTA